MTTQVRNAVNSRELAGGVYPFVRAGVCIVVVMLLVTATGCSALDAQCTNGARRCNGSEIEECSTHPSGTDVSADPVSVSHHKSSPNSWQAESSCGAANLCQTGTYKDEYGEEKSDAFCSLDAQPDPACGSDSAEICSGSGTAHTYTSCRAGFAIERQACSACDDPKRIPSSCAGGIFASCTADGDCAPGLTCTSHTCNMACACPEGAPCAICSVLDARAAGPMQGAPFSWICRSNRCFEQYQE